MQCRFFLDEGEGSIGRCNRTATWEAIKPNHAIDRVRVCDFHKDELKARWGDTIDFVRVAEETEFIKW